MKKPCIYCLSRKFEYDVNKVVCKKCGISYSQEVINNTNYFIWMYLSIFRVFSILGYSQDFKNNRYIPELVFHSIKFYKFNIIVWKWLYNFIRKLNKGIY
jgi:hypothetical protein